MTKTKQILNYLKEGHQITQLEATDMFGTTRLAAIVFNLKEKGYNIKTHMVSTLDRLGNAVKFAKYELITDR